VIVGIGGAFVSGALSAWITDALIRRGEVGELRRVFATAGIVRGVAALGAGFIGAMVGAWSLRSAWLLDAIFLVIATLIALRSMRDEGEPVERITEWEALRKSMALVRSRPALRWGIAASMIFGLVVPFNHYWSLYFREEVSQVGLGIIWIVIYAAVTASGFLVRHVRVPQGSEWHLIAWVLVAAGLGLSGMGLASGLMIPIAFTVLHEIGRGAFEPLVDSFTQHRVESSYRATYGSLHSLLGRIGFGLTLVGVWIGTHALPNTIPTIRVVLLISGTLLAVLALLLWLFRPQEGE
jgi:MFS family permease